MFIPKKVKHRKVFKGRLRDVAKGGTSLVFGSYGLKALGSERITSKQIEASRKVISRTLRRAGKVWIRMFADIPVTAKPADVRMGKGKGSVDHWVCKVAAGKVLFEIGDVAESLALEALSKAAAKLPVKCRFISIEDEF